MLHLVKKAAAAKNIPLLALALFAAVFMGSKVYASFNVVQEQHWLYDAQNCADPTLESCYTPASSPLSLVCEEVENEVCGINAPDNGSGQPLIQGTLATDLASGDFENKPNIFTMPRVN